MSATSPFDQLVTNARTSGKEADLDALYGAFFALEDWNFIVSQNSSLEEAKPFIGVVDEKPWLFVFTDGLKATEYARTAGGFLEKDGHTVILRLASENATHLANQLYQHGVYGIRVNDGANGWYFDIPALDSIRKHLNL
ncbi:hypothetical protein [Fluviicola sp.]|uniref:hypothetical protein n=1 Tax=Fluviicola sp. TaxID=1917219 RepID=UPI0031D54FF9